MESTGKTLSIPGIMWKVELHQEGPRGLPIAGRVSIGAGWQGAHKEHTEVETHLAEGETPIQPLIQTAPCGPRLLLIRGHAAWAYLS